MFTPELADKIQAFLQESNSVHSFDRIEDGQEFVANIRTNLCAIDKSLIFAMQSVDDFQIDFNAHIITLYLWLPEEDVHGDN